MVGKDIMARKLHAHAYIEKSCIIIRVHLDYLPTIVDGAWAAGGMDTRYKVTNCVEFGRDLVAELNHEAEDGTTRIHKMFDGAIEEAISQGAFGIEEHENQVLAHVEAKRSTWDFKKGHWSFRPRHRNFVHSAFPALAGILNGLFTVLCPF